MKVSRIKRHYFDMRTGMITVSPALQLSNFLMLSYLTISEVIPIYIFAPLFIVGILIAFTTIGNKFRKHQTPTDINLQYEKGTQAAKTVVEMMRPLDKIMKALDIPEDEELKKRIKYMQDISEGKL